MSSRVLALHAKVWVPLLIKIAGTVTAGIITGPLSRTTIVAAALTALSLLAGYFAPASWTPPPDAQGADGTTYAPGRAVP